MRLAMNAGITSANALCQDLANEKWQTGKGKWERQQGVANDQEKRPGEAPEGIGQKREARGETKKGRPRGIGNIERPKGARGNNQSYLSIPAEEGPLQLNSRDGMHSMRLPDVCCWNLW